MKHKGSNEPKPKSLLSTLQIKPKCTEQQKTKKFNAKMVLTLRDTNNTNMIWIQPKYKQHWIITYSAISVML